MALNKRTWVAAAFCLAAAGDASAGTFPFWGISFGTPERAALHLGATFGGDVPSGGQEGISIGTGTIVEARAGMGGGSLGIGKSVLLLTESARLRVLADLQLVGTRTWESPRGASAHATYVGVDGGLSISFVRFSLGVSKRVEKKARGADVLFNWGVGLQIRFGGSGSRGD